MTENLLGEDIKVAASNSEEVMETTEPVEQATEEEITSSDENQEDNTEVVKVKKPRNSGFHKKIARLEQQNLELAARLAEISKPAQVSTEKPELDKFNDFLAYEEALLEWKLNEREKVREEKAKKEQEEKKLIDKQNNERTSWEKKIDSLDEAYDDYEEVVSKYNNVPVRQEIIQATLESDLGPQIRYYLAKNPDVLESINVNSKSSLAIYKKIAELEVQLSKKTPVKVSKSSEPITPLKGSSKTSVRLEEIADADQWIAKRHPHLYGKK